MTTVDDALAAAARWPPPDGARRGGAPVTERGRLIVSDQAARHLAEGVAQHAAFAVREVHADVTLGDDGVDVALRVAAAYPDRAVSGMLGDFRRQVTTEMAALLGRPVRRLDVTVTELYVDVPAPRRVH